MTSYITRIIWKLRGRRQVRLQLVGNAGAIDGILIGTIAGHYRLVNAFIIVDTALPPEEMLGETWVLKDRVFLLNVKSY